MRYLICFPFFFSCSLFALPSVVPDPIPCVIYLETHFFTVDIVSQALSLYGVRQELWLLINEALEAANKEIPERMKRKTAYMVPNPIEYPMQKAKTAKILKEVLQETFKEVLARYKIENTSALFDYIFSRKRLLFEECFGVS